MSTRPFLALFLLLVCGSRPVSADEVTVTSDVVYGHKYGLALTFDVFTPTENANGAGVLFMVSGGWYSRWTPPEKAKQRFQPLTEKGFTVFAVRHGSSPKFSIPEAVEDVRRSVRFIRMNAERFQVDPDRLGVYGASAGGHLSLMLGTAADDGNPKAKDPILRFSDRVQAVVAWVAPTDLQIMVWEAPDHLPAYDGYPALNLDLDAARKHSPLVHVTPDDAHTLLVVGDQDKLVPIKHSRDIHAAFEKAGVRSQLVVLEGAGHGFGDDHAARAVKELVAWFEKHLAAKEEKTKAKSDQAAANEWKSLFDGKSLGKWAVIKQAEFEKRGKTSVNEGSLLLKAGSPATGVRWTGEFPRTNYELTLEGKRVEQSDFFCGLTFPVEDQALTLILGGWGGRVVGLSCIDGLYAVDNETCQGFPFENDRWYRVRVRVTNPNVQVWLDEEQIIDLDTTDRKLAVSEEMEPCLPLGLASWQTSAALRKMRYRRLPQASEARKDTEP